MMDLNAFPDEAILTTREVAQWLGCSEKSVLRLPIRRAAIPSLSASFLAKDVKDTVLGRERRRAIPRPKQRRKAEAA
jgi:hypothetical protein